MARKKLRFLRGKKDYWMIIFDLKTKEIDKLKMSRSTVYKAFEEFFEEEGFAHVQGSVYESVDKITFAKADATLEKLGLKFPWAEKVVRSMRLARPLDIEYAKILKDNTELKEKSQEKNKKRCCKLRDKILGGQINTLDMDEVRKDLQQSRENEEEQSVSR